MQVQVHTQHVVRHPEELVSRVEAEVDRTLDRFRDQLTRVEVHLSDVNGHKPGGPNNPDKRCLMEARPAGHQPVAVSHEAATWDEAIARTAEKLEASLDKMAGRLGHQKGRTSFGGDQVI